jgi:hypothetical protein
MLIFRMYGSPAEQVLGSWRWGRGAIYKPPSARDRARASHGNFPLQSCAWRDGPDLAGDEGGLKREDLRMKVAFTKNLGMLLLGIWLILAGLVGFVPLVASLGILLSFLAIAAGVLILIGR